MKSSERLEDREQSKEEAYARYKKYIEPHLDPEMVALWTQFEAGEKKGRIEGELEGKLKGKLEGHRSVLLRLLTQRFGLLSPAQLARLEATSLEELEVMTLRILTAGSVDEVLCELR